MEHTRNSFFIGISWKLANLFIFSLITVLNKIIITDSGLNVIQIFCLEMFFGFIFLNLLGLRTNFSHYKKVKLIYIRVILEVSSMLLWLFCLKMVPATLGMGIRNINPILTSALAAFFLKEKCTIGIIASIIIGFFGAMSIGGFTFSGLEVATVNQFIVFILIMSSFFNSIAEVINKRLCNLNFPIKDNALISFGLSCLLTLPFAIYYWENLSIKYLLYIIMVSSLFVANYLCHLKAIKSTNISLLVPFSFSKLFFTSIIAYILLGEIISLDVIKGSSFILIGLTILAIEQWKEKNANKY